MPLVWLAWVVCGAVIGLIATAARITPGAWSAPWRLALLGAGAALLGGWLGTLVWGSIFATSAALWVAVVGVVVVPRLAVWLLGRRKASRWPSA
jgi:hypothetical protein